MAKDKTKDKGEKTASKFARPSDAPAGGEGWKLEADENDGKLLLITPLRKETIETKKYGDKEVIVSDIVVINRKKPEKSEEHEDVYVWGAWIQGAIRSSIGDRQVLGTFKKQKDDSSGKGYIWVLEDADEKDEEAAEAYLASLSPFKKDGEKRGKSKPVEKASKGKSDDAKAGKKKSKK